jgi:hypothetical protein
MKQDVAHETLQRKVTGFQHFVESHLPQVVGVVGSDDGGGKIGRTKSTRHLSASQPADTLLANDIEPATFHWDRITSTRKTITVVGPTFERRKPLPRTLVFVSNSLRSSNALDCQ